MSLTMAHAGNGNITHSPNQTPRLSRRGSMGINYAPYISLVFMPHTHARSSLIPLFRGKEERENDSTNQTPAKQRMASLTHTITKLIKLIITNRTHTENRHTHTLLLQNGVHFILVTTECLSEIKTKLRTV